jgi:hypothetical protein
MKAPLFDIGCFQVWRARGIVIHTVDEHWKATSDAVLVVRKLPVHWEQVSRFVARRLSIYSFCYVARIRLYCLQMRDFRAHFGLGVRHLSCVLIAVARRHITDESHRLVRWNICCPEAVGIVGTDQGQAALIRHSVKQG